MFRNKGVVYLSFHLSKSDVKAHDILYSESLVFCMDNVQKYVFMDLLFCVHRLGSKMHIVVHCENMYNVQLSSQLLFSQLHVRSFNSYGAAVEWFIIVGPIP